jgi:hypothetical protein
MPLLACGVAFASETVSFYSIPSQGSAGMASYTATLGGGYTMGALDWNGFASVLNSATYGSELTLDLSGPLGAATITLGSGTTFSPGAWFSGSTGAFDGLGDPAGTWTFDFYESYDDGGDGQPDAIWDEIHFTFNDYVQIDYVWFQDFNAGIPGDWTLTGSPFLWTTNDIAGRDNYTGGSGTCAIADSDEYNYDGLPYDTSLISPVFTVPSANATLEFDAAYNDIGNTDKAEANILIGGERYVLMQWDEDHSAYGPGEHVSLDLSAYAGQTAQIEFRYHGPGWDWYYEVDNAGVTPEPTSLMLLGLGLVLLRRR